MKKIELTESAIKKYLDKAIKLWRQRREEAVKDSEDELVAKCYVDAFQSVRTSLFDELLEEGIITFDPAKPCVCPKCGESRAENRGFWISADGIWHFTCFECGAEWKARAIRKENKQQQASDIMFKTVKLGKEKINV